jgi:hypothetical protein
MGRTGGGVVQMTTKSGTNKLHGSAYWFIRNDAFDARNFFAARKPVLRYNQPGASISGPIRRDKTFFFFNYEAIRRKSQDTAIVSIPSPAERNGDFSGGTLNITDPLTPANVPFQAGSFRPAGWTRSDGHRLYPDPNVPDARSRANNYRANQPINNPSNIFVTRIDHGFNQNHRVYGRYLTNSKSFNDAGSIFPTAGVDSLFQRADNGYHNWSITYLHNITPNTIGELRWQWGWRKFHNYGGLDLGLTEKLGLRGTNPRYFPRINITGVFFSGSGEQERAGSDPW